MKMKLGAPLITGRFIAGTDTNGRLMKRPKASRCIAWIPGAFVAAMTFFGYPAANAQVTNTVYGNNAGAGGINSFTVDQNAGTGTFLQNYAQQPSSGNGRGVVVVGNIMYTTVTDDPRIYKTDVVTGMPLGAITTAVASMSTLAWDGSTFWTTDYAGSNKGFQLSTTGAILKTLTFANAVSNMDGMEWFNSKLIVNRGDAVGIYDIYDLNGNLIAADFFRTAGGGSPSYTGIAYDGTNFIVSDIFKSRLAVYDGVTGNFIKYIPLTGATTLIEDLSVDYAARADTGGFLPVLFVDDRAILQANATGIPMALSQRGLALSAVRTALRDVNGRLFRMRSGITGGQDAGGLASASPSPAPVSPSASVAKVRMRTGISRMEDPVEVGGSVPVSNPYFQSERFQLFGSADFGNTDRNDIRGNPGFNQNAYSGTVGAEYQVSRNMILGVAGSIVETDGRIGQDVGTAYLSGYAFSTYASFFSRNFFFDALYSYSHFEHDLSRNTIFDGAARAKPESSNHTVELNTGYNMHLGGLVTGPFAAMEFTSGELDGYSETGANQYNLQVNAQAYESLVTRVGWQASYPIRRGANTITPQMRLSWVHENSNGTDQVGASLSQSPYFLVSGGRVTRLGGYSTTGSTAAGGRDALSLGAGVMMEIGQRASLLLDYEVYLAQRDNFQQFASVRGSLKF